MLCNNYKSSKIARLPFNYIADIRVECWGLSAKNEMESTYSNNEWWIWWIYLHILSDQMLMLQKLKITQVLFWKNVFNSHWAVRWRELERRRQRERVLNYWQLSRMSLLTKFSCWLGFSQFDVYCLNLLLSCFHFLVPKRWHKCIPIAHSAIDFS